MSWTVADMTKLQLVFDQHMFDVVIDKAAMDALMCDEGDVWSPEPHVLEAGRRMCDGVSHVLTDKGRFLQVSFSQPHFRKKYLTRPDWTIDTQKIDVGFGYYCYVMTKS